MKQGWELIDGDVSFAHCGRPAYWENYEVYCSKCQTQLKEGEHTHNFECANTPGVFECECGAYQVWDRDTQTKIQYERESK